MAVSLFARNSGAQPMELNAYISEIACGSEQALEALYEATLSRVYGLALRITRSHFLAEEVVAETFMQVWRSATTFDNSRGNALAWLLVICRSRALDLLRTNEPAESHSDMEGFLESAENWAHDPQDILLALERDTDIHSGLAQLDPRERQMIALAFFKGMSHSEIATHMSLPLGTVKSGLRRALIALRTGLAP